MVSARVNTKYSLNKGQILSMHTFYKLYGRILAESLAEGRRPAFCSIEASIEAACSPACTEMSNGEIGKIIQQMLLQLFREKTLVHNIYKEVHKYSGPIFTTMGCRCQRCRSDETLQIKQSNQTSRIIAPLNVGYSLNLYFIA